MLVFMSDKVSRDEWSVLVHFECQINFRDLSIEKCVVAIVKKTVKTRCSFSESAVWGLSVKRSMDTGFCHGIKKTKGNCYFLHLKILTLFSHNSEFINENSDFFLAIASL